MNTKHFTLSSALLAMFVANTASAEPGSSFDLASGVLTIPCVDILADGEPAGEGGSRQSFMLSMNLVDGRLIAGEATEISAEGACSASFDSVTGVYTDLVAVDSDSVELTLSYAGGVDFLPSTVFFQRDFITEDLTALTDKTTILQLSSEIDSSIADIKLTDGTDAPEFIALVDGELRVSPSGNDTGFYSLRIEWGDQVETIELTVSAASDSAIPLDSLPAEIPAFTALNLYANDSVFNTPLPAQVAIDPDSDALIEGLNISEQFVVQVGQFSATVFFADSSTPTQDVFLPCGEFWELGITEIAGVPIPEWATPSNDVDGGDSPPIGCGEESAQDNFLIILDVENRCEYDFWQAREENGAWVASFATAFDMDGTGIHPNGLSSRGSGLAFLGGVIWPSELLAGEINHPLAFSYEFPKAGGPVAPATDSDGVSTESFALPEGARIQLDPDFDLDSLSLTDYERTIARAMQDYGLILVDRGGEGPVGLYAVDPDSAENNSYRDSWGTEDFINLDNLPIADLPLRVLELPAQDSDYRDNLQLADNRCSTYQ
ncbi:MAG: hypothetical protein MI746_14560 [Pseudomonadales bacterium]|nr:hypothetical protein [Pseudomonadales bacterium]